MTQRTCPAWAGMLLGAFVLAALSCTGGLAVAPGTGDAPLLSATSQSGIQGFVHQNDAAGTVQPDGVSIDTGALDGSNSPRFPGATPRYEPVEGAVPTVGVDAAPERSDLRVTGDGGATDRDETVITVSEISAGHTLISRLDLQRFRDNIRTLSDFGDRCRMSNCPDSPPDSYENAQNWVEEQLQKAGYDVYRHHFTTSAGLRSNLYVTKVGTVHPDQMYIVSAHLDGRAGGGAADDNASGSSLVLEMARLFASPDVDTDTSIRFVWWDQEEEGIAGSKAYARDRTRLRGTPEEPDWLGMIAYDMILYDHGVPPQPEQIAEADLDIEYRTGTPYAEQAAYLANSMASGAAVYADYPAEVNGASTWTDDSSFWDYCPAFSVRENRRTTEIGMVNGQPRIHPFYHNGQDVYEAYTDLDYLFGFSAVKLTAGTLAEWTNSRILTATGSPAAQPRH
jgi:hypothetical protein